MRCFEPKTRDSLGKRLLDAVYHRTDFLIGNFRRIAKVGDGPGLDRRNLLQCPDSIVQLLIENRGALLDGLLAHLPEVVEKFTLKLLHVLAHLILDQFGQVGFELFGTLPGADDLSGTLLIQHQLTQRDSVCDPVCFADFAAS